MGAENGLKPLVELGLTDLESEIYTFLVTNSPATGYRIANRINKPTANTYKALSSLQAKGIVLLEDTTPRAYRAVPTRILMDRLEKRFFKMKSLAAFELSRLKPAEDDEKVYRLHTPEQVYERFREMLKKSKKIVLLDLFPAAVEELKADIEAAADRGVNVLVKLYRPAEIRGCQTIVEPEGPRIMKTWPGIGANGIGDGREHVISFLTRDGKGVHDALWSQNTMISVHYHSGLIAEMLLEAFWESHPERKKSVPEKARRISALRQMTLPGYAMLLKRFFAEQPSPRPQPEPGRGRGKAAKNDRAKER